MKKFLAAAALTAVSIVPMSATAETQDALTMQMAGVMPQICTAQFKTPNAGQISGVARDRRVLTNDSDGLQAAFLFDVQNQTDPSDDTVGEIERIVMRSRADFFCNGAYTLTIEPANGALINQTSVSNTAEFSNQLNYRLTIDIGDEPRIVRDFTGSVAQDNVVSGGAEFDGDIVFRFVTDQSAVDGGADKKLIAGLYQEAVTLSFVQDGDSPAAAFTNAPAPVFAAN
ncbi:MAG: hypothetical protein AAGJ28_00830 [Pseudomonadota bacterium]